MPFVTKLFLLLTGGQVTPGVTLLRDRSLNVTFLAINWGHFLLIGDLAIQHLNRVLVLANVSKKNVRKKVVSKKVVSKKVGRLCVSPSSIILRGSEIL